MLTSFSGKKKTEVLDWSTSFAPKTSFSLSTGGAAALSTPAPYANAEELEISVARS